MTNRVFIMLALILMVPISAYAQNEPESLQNDLLSEMESGEELWELDVGLPFLELSDMWMFWDILLGLCLELELTDEEICEMLPDLWDSDYEPYLLWEDDWCY